MDYTGKKVLVAGGAGMIGSHLARELCKKDALVTIADNLSSGSKQNIRDILHDYPNSRFKWVDLRTPVVCRNMVRGQDYVYQLSANMGGILQITKVYADIIRDNALINLNMLEAARNEGIKKYFWSSSACFIPKTEVITNLSFKPISKVMVGDKVLTDDGEYHCVRKVGSRMYKGDMLNIRTYGVDLSCTPEHPFVIDEDGRKWKTAKELKKGDYIVITRSKGRMGEYPSELPLLPDKYVNQIKLAEYLKQLGHKVNAKEARRIAVDFGVTWTQVYQYSHGYKYQYGKRKVEYRPRFRNTPINVEITAEFMELLGIFIAEGWTEYQGVAFAFNDNEPAYADRCKKLVENIFNVKAMYRNTAGQKGFKYEIRSRFLRDFFKKLAYDDSGVYRASSKAIPSWVFNTPIEYQESFLKGYWLGDGSFTFQPPRHMIVACSTVSETLFWQLRTLMLQMGILTSIYKAKKRTHILGRKVNSHTPCLLYVRDYYCQSKLSKIIGVNVAETVVRQKHNRLAKIYPDYIAIPIKHITKKEYSGLVWNLEIEDNHTYNVQNVAVHNCVYPEYKQLSAEVVPLKEEDAYPAAPDQAYGWEKIFTEQLCSSYIRDYGMDIRIARFHNIYGDGFTSYDKQKAKAPCHLIIKAIRHPEPIFNIWGDGEQTRSFCYIDDCIEAVLKLMDSDYNQPINIGTDRLVTIKELADIIIKISDKDITPEYDLTKPVGVRGRNASLVLVKEVLDWEPTTSLEKGLEQVYQFAVDNWDRLENI